MEFLYARNTRTRSALEKRPYSHIIYTTAADIHTPPAVIKRPYSGERPNPHNIHTPAANNYIPPTPIPSSQPSITLAHLPLCLAHRQYWYMDHIHTSSALRQHIHSTTSWIHVPVVCRPFPWLQLYRTSTESSVPVARDYKSVCHVFSKWSIITAITGMVTNFW